MTIIIIVSGGAVKEVVFSHQEDERAIVLDADLDSYDLADHKVVKFQDSDYVISYPEFYENEKDIREFLNQKL